jgi:hypothetical protein
MSFLVYMVSKGEIIPASDHDQFWPEGATKLELALEHHGYCGVPEIELGGDSLSVAVYRVDSPKTDFGEKYHYVAHYIFANTFEIVLIPRLGDLNAFLSQVAPLCMAQLQQSAHNQRVEREREAERAKRRVSGQLGNRPRKPGV